MKRAITICFIFLLCYALLGCKPEPPEADFTAMPREGEVPLEVQFTDRSVGEIDEWRWDFDDDGTVDSTLQNPRHIYDKAGTYSVRLTVNNAGGSNYETKIGYLEFTLPCKVDFIAESTEVTGIQAIQFTDLSEGQITSWAWDFDSDGVTDSTEQNPIYSYSRNGDYTVTLTIQGQNCELSVTKDRYIHVSGCSV